MPGQLNEKVVENTLEIVDSKLVEVINDFQDQNITISEEIKSASDMYVCQKNYKNIYNFFY